MNNENKRKLYPANPLGIIALFVFFIEAIATISLKLLIETESDYIGHIVWFVIIYPSSIAVAFFVTLIYKRESLYSPADFKDDSSFVRLFEKVETLGYQTEALRIDTRGDDVKYALKIIEGLVERNEFSSAIHSGQGFLKVGRYEDANSIFLYIKNKLNDSTELNSRINKNLAYSYIGMEKYDTAIGLLTSICLTKNNGDYQLWPTLGLAYSYMKSDDIINFNKWMRKAINTQEILEKLDLAIKTYPELENELRSNMEEVKKND